MRVIEVFSSIQGEGVFIGTPSVFLRLAACDLRCTWCDTVYSYEGEDFHPKTRSVASLAESIRGSRVNHLVLTGGEPMLQAAEVEQLLRALQGKLHVTVETNGRHFTKALAPLVDYWDVSPKLASSKAGTRFNIPILYDRKVMQRFSGMESATFKFVVANPFNPISLEADLQEVARFVDTYGPINPVILQPNSRAQSPMSAEAYARSLRLLSEALLSHEALKQQALVLPQLHWLMWGGAPGH